MRGGPSMTSTTILAAEPRRAHLYAGQGEEEEDGEAVGVERVDGRHPQLRLEEEVVDLKQQDDEGREEALQGGPGQAGRQ